jgi:hypothetical protein
MATVEELKTAIDELTPEDRGALCPYWRPDWEKHFGVTAEGSARIKETPATELGARVKELKAKIDALSHMEKAELNALVQDWPDDEWDKQMRADCEPGGKLHKLMLEAQEDAKAGRLSDWPEPPAE